jgi:hypothetical protein
LLNQAAFKLWVKCIRLVQPPALTAPLEMRSAILERLMRNPALPTASKRRDASMDVNASTRAEGCTHSRLSDWLHGLSHILAVINWCFDCKIT